ASGYARASARAIARARARRAAGLSRVTSSRAPAARPPTGRPPPPTAPPPPPAPGARSPPPPPRLRHGADVGIGRPPDACRIPAEGAGHERRHLRGHPRPLL